MSDGEPSDLARVLVTYIPDDEHVRQIIIERTSVLSAGISLRRIAQIRAKHEREVKMLKRGKIEKDSGQRRYHLGFDGREGIAEASQALLNAIAREHPERVKP